MAKRKAASAWARTFQRGLKALSQAAARAARAQRRATLAQTTRAVTEASRKARTASAIRKPARATAAAAPVTARDRRAGTAGFGVGMAGLRRYRLFVPPGQRPGERLPLLVMLHGCGQDATAFALATRMNRLAARERCLVLYPEQDRLAHAQGCWRWFDLRSGRAGAEAASIMAAIDQVARRHPVDAGRVAVAGLSAGAGMAALLASRHPSRFCAVAMHSGVAPGVARSTAGALRAMRGLSTLPPTPPPAGAPPLLVIHGSADPVVLAGNGEAAARCWAEAAGARPGLPRRLQRGQRHAMTVTDFKVGGRTAATLCKVEGLGHAWSGGTPGRPFSDPRGPDAARLIWAFFARQWRRLPR